GAGARVRRSIGRPELKNFDPFLMLDEFKSEGLAGFPDHPHRGFETVTYMLPDSIGSMQHEDFKGNKGVIGPGDLQWMTAGRGVIHSEMPTSKSLTHGTQLWINLRKADKMTEPRYQELPRGELTTVERDGVKAIVIAGEAMGVKSPIYTHTPIHYSHFILQPGAVVDHGPIPSHFNTFIYTLKGKGKVGRNEEHVNAHTTVTFSNDGEMVHVEAGPKTGFEFLAISGEPINEPVVQHGPFVMNHEAEIMQAFDDYRRGQNGFEKALSWKSEHGRVY
ncbi:hypothetical protein FOL47_000834, partial [Perkinsus chesapeaki]